MKYNTKVDRLKSVPETCKGGKTEQKGFVSNKRRIESLLAAGRSLAAYREGQFDVQPGENVDIDKVQVDPTRDKGFDLADASQMARGLNDKAVAASKAAKGKDVTDGGKKSVVEVSVKSEGISEGIPEGNKTDSGS